MKRILCMVLSLALCLSLALPVAAKDKFVPSITYKDKPTFVPVNPDKTDKEENKDKDKPEKEDKDKDKPEKEDKDKSNKEDSKDKDNKKEDKVVIGVTKKEKDKPDDKEQSGDKDKPGEKPDGKEPEKPDDKNKPGDHPGQESEAEPEEEFEHISDIYDTCLIITAVSEAMNTTEQVAEQIDDQSAAHVEVGTDKHIAETLKHVYEELNNGNMKLPYEKVENCKAEDMVILELLDISWVCGKPEDDHNHEEQVRPEKVVFDLTLALGVAPDARVVIMTYDEHTGEWDPIPKVINNGDGSVTCTFEHFCPIAISIEQPSAAEETAAANIGMWVAVMLAAAAGVVVVLLGMRKKQKNKP